MKLKQLLLFLIIFISFFCLKGQEELSSVEYLKRLDRMFLSPQATAFQKHSYFPVSPSTGTTNVLIPIYKVQQGELELPVSLVYHTGGIKVNDSSTPVGLGWLLDTGGAITRSRQGSGSDDDFNYGYLKQKDALPTKDHLNRLRSLSDYDQEKIDFFYFCRNIVGVGNQTFKGRGIDFEPDMFTYNFAGRTGVFYFSTTGNIVTESKDPFKIEMLDSYTFIVTDENGIKYTFNKPQSSYKSSVNSNIVVGLNMYLFESTVMMPHHPSGDSQLLTTFDIGFWRYIGTSNFQTPCIGEMETVDAWYLTKISHPNGEDTIELDYKTVYYDSQKYISQSKEVIYDYAGSYNVNNRTYDLNTIENSFINRMTDQVLTKIRFKSGEVLFVYAQDRLDSNAKDRLRSIICKNKLGEPLVNVELDNNKYFTANFDGYSSNDKDNKRLKLEKVLFKDKNNKNVQTYEYYYNENSLPPINSKAVDHWGYFNGIYNNSLIPKIHYKDDATGVQEQFGDADKRAVESKMKAFILEKIIYPTGSMMTIDYTCNKAYSSLSKKFVVNVGGLKVSRMRLYPNCKKTSEYTEKVYEYSFNGYKDIGKPISHIGPEFNFQFNYKDGGRGVIWVKSFIINSNPVNSMNMPGYSNVLYDRVIETERNANGQTNGHKESLFDLGDIPKHYHDAHTYGDLVFLKVSDYYDPEHLNFRALNSYGNAFFVPVLEFYPVSSRPYLLKESHFNKDSLKVQEISKAYTKWIETNENVRGLYVSSYRDYKRGYIAGGELEQNYFPDKYYYFLYDIPIEKRLLTSESEYLLTLNGAITKTTKYEYEYINGMLRRSSTKRSNEKTFVTENWYPFDYSHTIPLINKLNRMHILSPVIMQAVKNANNEVVNAYIMELNEKGEPITYYELREC